ncbi:MAG: ISKra4-like element ISTvi1 family transposase, partial [Sulfuricella sp.]
MMEPQYRKAAKRIRPFAQSAQVSHRGCSRPLQRAVTDFGADLPFAQVMDKLVEHYGIVLGESTIRHITEGHAQQIFETAKRLDPSWPINSGSRTVVIVEMDGGMVPIVEPDATRQDQRKGKKLQWKEAKICLAHPQGSKTLAYGGTLQGDADAAGQQLLACATQAGFGRDTPVHAVG